MVPWPKPAMAIPSRAYLAAAISGKRPRPGRCHRLAPYPIVGGTIAKNCQICPSASAAAAFQIIPLPQLSSTPVDFIRETVDTYVYDRNFGAAPVCAKRKHWMIKFLASTGDALANEWSKVRLRPDLTNCFDSESAVAAVTSELAGATSDDPGRHERLQILNSRPRPHAAIGRIAQAHRVRRDGEIPARHGHDLDRAVKLLVPERDLPRFRVLSSSICPEISAIAWASGFYLGDFALDLEGFSSSNHQWIIPVLVIRLSLTTEAMKW